LRARFRLRTAARRFISTLRSSSVSLAQKALPAALAIFLRCDFGTPFQRLRPAARNLARGITITSSVLPIFVNFLTLTPTTLAEVHFLDKQARMLMKTVFSVIGYMSVAPVAT
jgi:hypothetical protein